MDVVPGHSSPDITVSTLCHTTRVISLKHEYKQVKFSALKTLRILHCLQSQIQIFMTVKGALDNLSPYLSNILFCHFPIPCFLCAILLCLSGPCNQINFLLFPLPLILFPLFSLWKLLFILQGWVQMLLPFSGLLRPPTVNCFSICKHFIHSSIITLITL